MPITLSDEQILRRVVSDTLIIRFTDGYWTLTSLVEQVVAGETVSSMEDVLQAPDWNTFLEFILEQF